MNILQACLLVLLTLSLDVVAAQDPDLPAGDCSALRETAHPSGQTSPPPLHKPLHLIKAGLDFLGRINRRRIQTRMAKVLLHDVERHALFDRMRSAGMPQPMGRSGLELSGIVRLTGFDHLQRHPGEAVEADKSVTVWPINL